MSRPECPIAHASMKILADTFFFIKARNNCADIVNRYGLEINGEKPTGQIVNIERSARTMIKETLVLRHSNLT